MKTILFNGIPNSGKSTLAYKLHLRLEHAGYSTIYLDDEVIKRMDAPDVIALVESLKADYFIVASVDPKIKADLVIWCECPLEIAYKRDIQKNFRDNSPNIPTIEDYISGWDRYTVPYPDLIVDTTKNINHNREAIWKAVLELKTKS